MGNITLKNKVIISSALALIYYLFAHQIFFIEIVTSHSLLYLSPVLLTLVMALGCIWILNSKSGIETYVNVILYCCVNVFVFSLFFEILLINQTRLGQISITIVFSLIMFVIFYVHFLTANIINLSHIKDIPLIYAARATAYIISLLSEYFIFFMTVNSYLNLFVKLLIIVGISFFHSYFLLGSIRQKFSNKLYSSIAIACLIMGAGIMLALWPVSSEIKAIILTLIMYICIGISLEIKERINRSIWIEYIILIFSIIFLLILLASWGINGHLL